MLLASLVLAWPPSFLPVSLLLLVPLSCLLLASNLLMASSVADVATISTFLRFSGLTNLENKQASD
jgi:hypothetical protein